MLSERHQHTGIKQPRAYFTETGALWMLGKTKCDNDAMQERLATFGVKSDVLDDQLLRQKFWVPGRLAQAANGLSQIAEK